MTVRGFLVASAIILPCFGAAFALSKLVDRVLRRRMPHFARGLIILALGVALFYGVGMLLIMTCGLSSSCDI